MGHVVRNLTTQLPAAEAGEFALPPIAEKLIARGSVGEKSGEGFYKRQKGPGGASEILTLDPATLTYRARQSPRLPQLDAVKPIEDLGERTKALFLGKDKVGDFLRSTLGPLLIYAARTALDEERLGRPVLACDGSAHEAGHDRVGSDDAPPAPPELSRTTRERRVRAAAADAARGTRPRSLHGRG
jgi:hypothetical protein